LKVFLLQNYEKMIDDIEEMDADETYNFTIEEYTNGDDLWNELW